jgi:hypothetical protein
MKGRQLEFEREVPQETDGSISSSYRQRAWVMNACYAYDS